ncbi:hypothetical protein RFF05_04110 [Bengtsoniella intestinalis]|uniref:hypothetical protein n=1 Tax=Bengtsoniella intestinalis TaxID=3073143 RepID=UPI00391FAA74
MTKRILAFCLCVALLCGIATTAFAVGDGNVDSGGGDMGTGTSSSYWNPGMDGVRVTVIRASDYSAVTTPIDLTNKTLPSTLYHFGKVCKIQYTNGLSLSAQQGNYTYYNPSQSLPTIVSTTGSNNIDAIKSYFTDEQVIRAIAGYTGFNYDTLINGDYKLLLEPIAYYYYQGVYIATTATEAAMYDEIVSGALRTAMQSLSHKNLPLAMFLETSDLGYSAWTGSTTSAATNADIKASLGLGIVRFEELPEEVPEETPEETPEEVPEDTPEDTTTDTPDTTTTVPTNPGTSTDTTPDTTNYDYEYRVNTEVITSVYVSGGQSDPDDDTVVYFYIDGTRYSVSNVYYPSGDGQLVWVKWTTPSTPQAIEIDVTVSGLGASNTATILCNIVDLDENPPPNPVADDSNDSFTYTSVPSRAVDSSATWGIWTPWWQEYWVDNGYWKTSSWTDSDGVKHTSRSWKSNWEDEGWWEFDYNQYSASLTTSMSITCDDENPTASGSTMKSGYGINQLVTASVSTTQSTATTSPQNAVSYFPEFGYDTYWRLLEETSSGKFQFQKNVYSTYNNRTHFTPIWYPDGAYTVNTWVIDCWTPVGMLSANLTDSLTISGSLWDDWHIAPLNN